MMIHGVIQDDLALDVSPDIWKIVVVALRNCATEVRSPSKTMTSADRDETC